MRPEPQMDPTMNEALHPYGAPEVPWPTSDQRARVPDTSMLPGSEKAPPAAVASLNRVVHAAHDAVDRFAESAAPKLRQLGERVAGAEAALHQGADQLGRTSDEWAEGMRGTVRRHPLTAVVAAAALGAVIVRAMR